MTKGKRGRLEGALRAWAAMPKISRSLVLKELHAYAAKSEAFHCPPNDAAAALFAAALLRAAGVETRKERK